MADSLPPNFWLLYALTDVIFAMVFKLFDSSYEAPVNPNLVSDEQAVFCKSPWDHSDNH